MDLLFLYMTAFLFIWSFYTNNTTVVNINLWFSWAEQIAWKLINWHVCTGSCFASFLSEIFIFDNNRSFFMNEILPENARNFKKIVQ